MHENKSDLLKKALAHEFYRCTTYFHTFGFLITLLPKNDTKEWRIECYNSYVDFLSHLYEFYCASIKKGSRNWRKTLSHYYPDIEQLESHEALDYIINEEMSKLFRNRKNRILNGYKDSLGHHVDFYDCEIPKEFGSDFRKVRNFTNHVNPERISNEYIALSDFFEKYHKFILILYYENVWLNNVELDQSDWQDVDEFAGLILN